MKIFIISSFLAIASSACDTKKETGATMTPKIEMKTHCVGRNVIELPVSYKLSNGSTGTFKAVGLPEDDSAIDLSILVNEVNAAQFATELVKRRTALTSSPDKTMDVLSYEKALSPEAKLFRVNRIKDAFVSEINFVRGGSYMTASLNSYRGSFLDAEKKLLKFIAKIDVNKDANASGGGFCIGNVIVRGDFSEETGSILYRDSKHPGTSFGMEVDTFQPDDKTSLLSRTSGPESLLAKLDVDPVVLRKGELTVSGMRAQEWLAWFKFGPNGEQKAFSFAMETIRTAPSKLSPSLHLSFKTGDVPSTAAVDQNVMADKDAVALWDAVVKSIRPIPR